MTWVTSFRRPSGYEIMLSPHKQSVCLVKSWWCQGFWYIAHKRTQFNLRKEEGIDSSRGFLLHLNMPLFQAELQMLSTGSQSPEPPVVKEPLQPSSGQSMVGLLEDRLTMYNMAMEAAKSTGDTSKARRLDRGIKVNKILSKFVLDTLLFIERVKTVLVHVFSDIETITN